VNIEWPAKQWILILVPPGCPMFLKAIADVGALGLVDLTVETLNRFWRAVYRLSRFAWTSMSRYQNA